MTEGTTRKSKCKQCENFYDKSVLQLEFGPEWWTELYCSANCAVLSNKGFIIKTYKPEMMRLSVTLPTHIYERVVIDGEIANRTANGQINNVLKNYYVAKDIAKNC